MAYFQRVIFCLSLGLLSFLPSIVFAAFPAVSASLWGLRNSGGGVEFPLSASSASAACTQFAAARQAYYASQGAPWAGTVVGSIDGTGVCVVVNIGTFYPFQGAVTYQCPAGASLSGSTCTCQAPTSQQLGTGAGSTCAVPELPDPCLAKMGTSAGRMQAPYSGGSLSGPYTNLCELLPASAGTTKHPGCGITVDYDFASGYDVPGKGVKTGYGVYTAGCTPGAGDGSSSSGAPPSSTPENPVAGAPAPTPCKAGEYTGSVNGRSVCIRDQSGTNVVKSDKKGTAGDGSVTEEAKNTSCRGSKCVTTTKTTTTPAGGGAAVVTTSSTEEPKDDYCTKNPRSAMCITSAYTGSCNGPQVCDGDAIQCAIAAQALRTACALSPEPDGSDIDYLAAKARPVGSVTGDLPGNSIISIGPGNFDQTDALGGGACIGDRSVFVFGAELTIPLSRVCPYLVILGNALLFVSFLLAGRIVVRG